MLYNVALVFAAHPDDEIMMAGTIARMAAEGTRVAVVQMTDGSEGYPAPDLKDTIVELRRREAIACDRVLGIAKRYDLGRPDMGLVNDKATLQELIGIIRAERPDAAFLQGDRTLHRDHLATFELTLEAVWHAGGPVAVALGAPWATPEVYLYKDAQTAHDPFAVDVTGFGDRFHEALATQESQHVLFAEHFGIGTPEEFGERVRQLGRENPRNTEYHWVARDVLGFEELPAAEGHRLPGWK